MEFAEKDSVENAVTLSDTLFKGRQIKVKPFITFFKTILEVDFQIFSLISAKLMKKKLISFVDCF